MRYLLLTGMVLFLLPLSITAGNLKGTVRDKTGNPLPAVSVYIREIKQGLICDEKGSFQIRLDSGYYHLEFRCIGYETNEQELTIPAGNREIELQIELTPRDFQLKEVTIHSGDDPADRIMREAIKKAPYYHSLIRESRYETYVKGAGKIVHVPKLLEKMAGEEIDLDMFVNRVFLQESLSEFTYTAPDQYEQRVIAFSSTFPNMEDPESAMGIGMISLYSPQFGNALGPLNPKAFDYYRFRYEDYLEENGETIHIIRVIPKLKDPKLLEGTLHIADGSWDIRYALLKTGGLSMKEYTFNFNRVANGVYLVTNYELYLLGNIMGMKLEARFFSSIQYNHILLNNSGFTETERAAPPRKKSLEIKPRSEKLKIIVDTLAVRRDSSFWEEIRTVRLNEEELKSYSRKDTVQAYTDSLEHASTHHRFSPTDLLTGGKAGNDSSLFRLDYPGLLRGCLGYNYVDGFRLGQSFTFDFKKDKNNGLILSPGIYWAASRKRVLWRVDASWDYAPLRLGRLELSAMDASVDYSGTYGMDETINWSYSLFAGRNYKKYYGNRAISLSNSIDIANGLRLGCEIELAERKTLENTTTWNLFGIKDKWTPNRPEYDEPLYEEHSDLARYRLNLKYTPEYYYRIREGKKQYAHTRFPTLELDFQQGVDVGFMKQNSQYSRLEGIIHQRIKLNLFDYLDYTLAAGKFLNKNNFNYIDYKHFDRGGPLFSFKNWCYAYTLLPYYKHSTSGSWVQAFVNYESEYLLLKRLPFLQGKMFGEALQSKFLHTPDKKYYSEWGYVVNIIGGMASLGIFCSFDSFDYNSCGIQFSIPLFNSNKRGTREVVISL